MQVKFLERTGEDMFTFIDMSEQDKNRSYEWALTTFVLINGVPMTLEDMVKLPGDKLTILKGRVFSMSVKGVEQDDKELRYKNIVIKRKEIPHNLIEKMTVKVQKVVEKGGSNVAVVKLFLSEFYDISLSELEKLPYQVAAFMFDKINSFFRLVNSDEDVIDFED